MPDERSPGYEEKTGRDYRERMDRLGRRGVAYPKRPGAGALLDVFRGKPVPAGQKSLPTASRGVPPTTR